jgi:hypothetical protein
MVMMVMVMRCALNMMMVVYWLTWSALWRISLSPIEGSGGIGRRNIIVWFVVMVVVMMTT